MPRTNIKRRREKWTGKTRIAVEPVCAAYGRIHAENVCNPFTGYALDWVTQKCCWTIRLLARRSVSEWGHMCYTEVVSLTVLIRKSKSCWWHTVGCWKSREHIELFKVLNGSSVRQFGRTPKAKSIKLDGAGVDFCTKQNAVGRVCVRFRERRMKTVAVKLYAFIFGA